MGNRAVITLYKDNVKNNFSEEEIGVYLHWNGGYSSVNAFLTYCDLRGFRSPDMDNYGWARLCQVLGNFFGADGLSVGVDKCKNLDCDNYDNGVYLIDGWKIVGRAYHNGREDNSYDLVGMCIAIDNCQPERQRLGEDEIRSKLLDKTSR